MSNGEKVRCKNLKRLGVTVGKREQQNLQERRTERGLQRGLPIKNHIRGTSQATPKVRDGGTRPLLIQHNGSNARFRVYEIVTFKSGRKQEDKTTSDIPAINLIEKEAIAELKGRKELRLIEGNPPRH